MDLCLFPLHFLTVSAVNAQTCGTVKKYHYNALGGNTGVTDTLGNTTKFDLDAWGRIRAVLKADGSREAYEYDHMGNMVRSTDANGFCVQYHYDVRGNMTARIDPGGARESFEYDKENRQTGHTDRNGSRIRTDYNMYGSITRRVAYKADLKKTKNAGIGQVTESYGYLPDGKLCYAISNGMRYDYIHDCMGRLIRKTASGRTLIENTYDLNGNRIRLVDITGKECNYHYDLLDRIESISGNQKEYVTYQYNDDGTLKRMVVGGNLVTEYTYDADKNVAGQRTYVENSWEKGTALLSGGSLQAEYERRQQQKEALAAKAARRSRYLQHTGQVGTGNDDSAGDGILDNLSLGALLGNANVIVNNTYTYDLLGHMTSKETLSGLTEYTYDKLGQITRAATSGRLEEFQYDPAGNRIGRRLTDREEEIHEKFLYDSQNRMLQRDIYKNSVTKEKLIERYLFEYDAQGSMVSETYQPFEKNRGTNCGMNAGVESGISQTVRTFSYDALNRLQEVKKEEKILQKNTYDAEGLRAEMEENGRLIKFIFDGDKVIAESDTTQGMKRYIRGYKLVSSECEQAKTYYHYTSDHLGSITDVVAETGEVHNHYEYDVFGNHTVCQEQVENRFGFAGEMLDPAINLYYLRARFYNPVIGRFIQEDNYLGDGLNLYEYCHNNPVAYVDPSGNKAISLCPNAENKAGADGDGKSGTPSGYYQDANGRWHRPNGQFASNAEIGLPNKTTKTSNGTRGGRLGNGDTRAQNKLIADYLKSKGYIIIGGGTYRPEEYLPGPNGTHKGSNYIDVTAKKGNIIIRINTVDIDSNGKPTQRELDAASSINQKTGGQIILIPKGAGLGDLEKILFGNN